jgi:hypothetical protein
VVEDTSINLTTSRVDGIKDADFYEPLVLVEEVASVPFLAG